MRMIQKMKNNFSLKKLFKGLSKAAVLLLIVFAFVGFANAKTVSAVEIFDSEDESRNPSESSSDNFTIGISVGNGSDLASVLQILLVLTVIALAPSILIMLTSFTRIIIVLHFTRAALGTQTSPPNQVLVGLALFLTFFIMAPTFKEVYDVALQPLSKNEISMEQAYEAGIEPLRTFMFEQTNTKDIKTFLEIAQIDTSTLEDYKDIPTHVLIPSFILSELRIAFIIGFLIYIPFIIIDMVVASALMSMGMMMLPPTTISMPFKILLFVMADGWNLIIVNLVKSFY